MNGSKPEGPRKTALLSPGDYYVTRHSNLVEAHVVFHLVVDDEVRAAFWSHKHVAPRHFSRSACPDPLLMIQLQKDNLSTRHPTLIGLRNIVRCVFQNNIHTLSVPLLLVPEYTEVICECHRRSAPSAPPRSRPSCRPPLPRF
jgi:hypothetical protein